MTPKQRFLAALNLEEPDRVPVFYQHLGGAKWILQSCGKTMKEGFHDPEVFAEIAMQSHKLFGFDNVMAGWGDILIEAQAHGTIWKWPERDFYPRVEKYAIVSTSDIEKVEPIDPIKDRFWSVPIRAAGIMLSRMGKEVEVMGCIDSPLLIAMEMMGAENLYMKLIQEPDMIAELIAKVTESSMLYGERISETGLGSVMLENGTAGAEQNSPDLCDRFDMKYLGVVLDKYRSLGLKTVVHNCAAIPFLDKEIALKPNAIHFNNKAVDLPMIFEKMKGRTCVVSGIDHTELMFKGKQQAVEDEVKRVIEIWGKAPGFIIAPGCEMPFKTPIENILSLVAAAERYGRS
ncbi:MAG: uroporphyrinogen decarboxylase family protein [Methanomassiliicoccales archaeon]|nr:uroporphyrinogen decarboxylase family protein [Methanomassiliicoccales archaeon]